MEKTQRKPWFSKKPIFTNVHEIILRQFFNQMWKFDRQWFRDCFIPNSSTLLVYKFYHRHNVCFIKNRTKYSSNTLLSAVAYPWFSTNFYETDVKSNFCQKYQQKTQYSVKCKDHLTTKKVHKWKKIIYFS